MGGNNHRRRLQDEADNAEWESSQSSGIYLRTFPFLERPRYSIPIPRLSIPIPRLSIPIPRLSIPIQMLSIPIPRLTIHGLIWHGISFL